jgi:hypothetical protein
MRLLLPLSLIQHIVGARAPAPDGDGSIKVQNIRLAQETVIVGIQLHITIKVSVVDFVLKTFLTLNSELRFRLWYIRKSQYPTRILSPQIIANASLGGFDETKSLGIAIA